MSEIIVYLDALHDVAGEMRRAVRDMDECVRRAYNDVHSMRDSGRGLNDVRQRAADVLRMHRAIEETGIRLERFVTEQADTFARTDQELAAMVRAQQFVSLSQFQLSAYRQIVGQRMQHIILGLMHVQSEWLQLQVQRSGFLALVQRYVGMMTTSTQLVQALVAHDERAYTTTVGALLHTHGNVGATGSTMLALAQLLTGFVVTHLPHLPARVTGIAFAPIASLAPLHDAQSSQYVHAMVTGAWNPWHDPHGDGRDISTVDQVARTSRVYHYSATSQQITDMSSGWCADARGNTDAVQQQLAMSQLPAHDTVAKWIVHDM